MARKRVRSVEAGNESNDSPEKQDTVGPCPHIGKGVEIGSLKKSWKKKEELSCQLCKKKSHPANKKATPQTERDLWICMKCGHIGCGNSRHDHGLEHYRTPRSDCHAVVAVVDTWVVRCLLCRNEINLDINIKALDAVEYLKRNFVGMLKDGKPEVEEVLLPSTEGKTLTKSSASAQEYKSKSTASHGAHHVLPVLGLENIGNTCYMNAVLQSLAQTPDFNSVLESVSQNGGIFKLPGGVNLISKDHDGCVPPLEGELGETGQLTKAVIRLLNRVKNGEHLRKTGVSNENPGDILRLMKKLSNTFYLGEQHDSHELLRLLLEGLRMEDLKRYQRGILKGLGICSPDKEITSKKREQLIAYKKQAMQNELAVDKIFSGSLVSILKCLECGLITTNFESIMDISLPVESEKPKVLHVERPVIATENKPSKNQLKKERKLARRGKKKNKGSRMMQEINSQLVENNKNYSSSESASDSEADVEDNLNSENKHNKKLSVDAFSSQVSSIYNNKEIPESTKFHFPNERSTVYECPDLRGAWYGSSPDEGAVIYGCSPEPGSVLYGCSPEAPTMTYGCSSEHSMLEDFGSCEGGRGSPASSIEQADWEEEANGRGDFAAMVKGVEKDLHINEDTVQPSEHFELSEEDNVKEVQWEDVSREDLISSDSQFEMFSSRLDPTPRESIDNKKKDKSYESCNNLGNDKLANTDDSYNNQDFDKQRVSNDIYNDLDSNKKLLEPEVTNKSDLLEINNIESDDNVWGITLAPLPEIDEKVYSVFNCLNQFFSKEMLCDSNQVGCLRCTKLKNGQEPNPNTKLVQANALKQLLFLKLPKVLTIHLKRFEVLRSRMCKITRKVSFPMVLDISPYTSNKTLNAQSDNLAKYELYAVVEHSGHMTSGHYVAYISVNVDPSDRAEIPLNADKRKYSTSGEPQDGDKKSIKTNSCQGKIDNPTKKWYIISDTHVREVAFKEVSNAEAYLLFYKQLN